MPIGYEKITFTLGTAGGGTFVSDPISGEVLSVRVPGAGTVWAGTADATDMTITRHEDGGTVVALTDMALPVQVQPRDGYHSLTGTLAGTAADTGVPVEGAMTLVIGDGEASQAGTVYVLYRR